MIKQICNPTFYKTLTEQQIAKTATRNKTSFDIGRIILKNNQNLCEEINLYNKANNSTDNGIYCLDAAGEFIKKIKNAASVYTVKVADNEILKFIEKIRAAK